MEPRFRVFDCRKRNWTPAPVLPLARFLDSLNLRFSRSIHAQTWVLACPEWGVLGTSTPALDLHWNDQPGRLLGTIGWHTDPALVAAVASELACDRAVRVLLFNSDSDLCFEEILVPPALAAVEFGEVPPPSDKGAARIEAALQRVELDSPSGRAQLQVYADLLQAAGDPRGTLAALQLQDPDNHGAREWLEQHRVEILGPLASALPSPELELSWTGGWITTIRMGPSSPWCNPTRRLAPEFSARGRSRNAVVPGALQVSATPPSSKRPSEAACRIAPRAAKATTLEGCVLHPLEALLRLPASACLRSLMLRDLDLRGFSEAGFTLIPSRESLRTLTCEGVRRLRTLGTLPRLERLELRETARGPRIDAPSLRELLLDLESLDAALEFVDTNRLGPVEALTLAIRSTEGRWNNRGPERLAALLGHESFGSLRRLKLGSSFGNFDGPWIVSLLTQAERLGRLECRDFSRLRLRPEDRDRLRDACASMPGETIV